MLTFATFLAQIQVPGTAGSSAPATGDGGGGAGSGDDKSFLEAMMQVDVWAQKVVDFLPAVLNALLVLVFFWVVFKLTRKPLKKTLERTRLQPALVSLMIDNLYKGLIAVFAGIMAAGEFGINVTAAVAGVGVVGIAVGFAAQDTLSNIIAGLMIFWDKPFEVGHWIETNDQIGCVAEINMRTTRIRTRQNTYVVIPNKHIIDAVIVNHSMYGEVRVDIPVGIAYKEKVAETRAVLLEAMRSVDKIDPERTEVVAQGLGASSVDLSLRVWTEDAGAEAMVFAKALEAAKVALDEAGIQIPFPHLQLFLDDVEDRAVQKLREVVSA